MADIRAQAHNFRTMESLAAGDTAIHKLHPMAKLLSACALILCAVSFGRYDFVRLAPYLFYPFVLMALAELPYRLLLSRVLLALPFCVCAGLANVFYDRVVAFFLGTMPVTYGALSMATILLKTYLCVMAALLLAGTTPAGEIADQLRRLRLPWAFVLAFTMTFRYSAILIEEAYGMMVAYRLRAGSDRAIHIRHMGPFVGQMVLRAFDRAERVYGAMRCRGYTPEAMPRPYHRRFGNADTILLVAVCAPSIGLRLLPFLA